ncbi:hypothetical protein J6590_066710 [Homalodisca vitripennis]|nr:hypothetical protein J6590_066710 [Homalodisca vitripennis]
MDDEVESQGIFEDELSDTSGVPACEQETPRRVSTPTVHTHTGAKLTGRKRRIEELSHAVKNLRAVSEIMTRPTTDPEEDEIDVFAGLDGKQGTAVSAADSGDSIGRRWRRSETAKSMTAAHPRMEVAP